MEHDPRRDKTDPMHEKTDPAQSDIGRGTPPGRTPESMPDTDLEPDQRPVRDTPDVKRGTR